MARVALVTDSAANIPAHLREQHGVVVVPIDLYLEGRLYRDEVDLSTEEFYRWFRSHRDSPSSTACPPPGEFLKVYEQLATDHDAIISIHLAARLSGTYESAQEAAGMIPEVAIDLVDSRSVSMAEGFCVLAAARSLGRGATAAEAAAAARGVAGQVRLFALLDSLQYVTRTGRVPSIAARAGALLHLHPVLEVRGGQVELLGVERTTRRATERLVQHTLRVLDGRPGHVAVVHADVPRQAQTLAETLATRVDTVELHIVQFTPVLGASAGPGLLGVALYAEDEEGPTGPDEDRQICASAEPA